MNYLKSVYIFIIVLVFSTGNGQANAQEKPTATKEQTDEIQGILDKMKELKEKGKEDDDPAIKELAKKAIALADKYYKLTTPDNVEGGEAEYDPEMGEGKAGTTDPLPGKKGEVKLGPKAFSSPGWLAGAKFHEFFHALQLADGRWMSTEDIPEIPEVIPGNTEEEKKKNYDELMKKLKELMKKASKANIINEIEAYDKELEDSAKFGLTEAEKQKLKKFRDEYFKILDEANQKKVTGFKERKEPYKISMLPSSDRSMFVIKNPELFVAGSVLSQERMLVTIRGNREIEGNVVSAEIDGRTTQIKTDKDGHAFLDMSLIAGNLTGTAEALIKVSDANGKPFSTATTTVEQGYPTIFNRPEIATMPDNIPVGEVITIPGIHLGAEAHLVLGEQFQETLSASDKEITAFTDCNTGNQPAYVVTANGVSHSQMVNVYSIRFSLSKSSITPEEKVIAQVQYQSIPAGTKLIITNNSPEIIKMTIPGENNEGNQCIFMVTNPNGTVPVDIRGIARGNFKISLNTDFKNGNQTPR